MVEDEYDIICIEHRIQYGLSTKNIEHINCYHCKGEDTCPLNPKYEDDKHEE